MERTAVITGASQGLGLALTRELLSSGWRVVIDARRGDRLGHAVEELRAELADADVVALPGDVTDTDHRAALVAAAAADGHRVDLVVLNASTLGGSPLPRLDAIEPEALRRTFDVNVVAPIALVQQLASHLIDGPTVVAITSDAGVEAYETWGGYGASKAALEHAARVLAVEQPDWRVLVVDPGDMRTEMHQDAFPGEDISDRPPPTDAARAIASLVASDRPSGRYAAAEVTS
jgi:NAD(P)-dependent dehydrogenase (short-subunit alcohol dehydrogenase family)